MLTIRKLDAGYGMLRVLFGVDLEVAPGGITVVVGPNGAGKTTLLSAVMGTATTFQGEMLFEGAPLTGLPTHEVARLGISYVPQMRNVFADLSVLDNLRMAGYMLRGDEMRAKTSQMLEIFPVLGRFIHRKAGTLSGGERRMLAIAMGLMKKPRLMLLDELSTDLAPIMAKKVMAEVARLRSELGMTILLVEQMAKRALEIGDTAYLLVSGEVRFSGKACDLLRDPEMSRIYLGVKEA